MKVNTPSSACLARSLNLQNPVVCGLRDCPLGIRLLADVRGRGNRIERRNSAEMNLTVSFRSVTLGESRGF